MMISDRTVGPVTFDSEYLQAQAGASLDSWALTDPDSGRDAFVAVTIHRTLVLLRNYALKEGNGVVTEYELDRLIIPITRKLRALANGDNEGDDEDKV